MTNLTLQINNLEALERLIGGDSKVEIEIRNSVVQKFAEKHLKSVANVDVLQSTLNQIQKEINEQVKTKCESEIASFKKSYGNNLTDIKIHPSIQSEINSQVSIMVGTLVRTQVDNAMKLWMDEVSLKNKIEYQCNYLTTNMINQEIKRRLEEIKKTL